MVNRLTKSFFIALSNHKFLNRIAQQWGFKFGAEQFVAGASIDHALSVVEKLNKRGKTATVDHLGEFVTDRTQSIAAKKNIIALIELINKKQLNCHISVKLTQLGLHIAYPFCLKNMQAIVKLAHTYNIFINIDTENYAHLDQTLMMLKELRKNYDNIGIAIQAYLLRSEKDMDSLKDVRLRIVKGAYKENAQVAYLEKEAIDQNFLKLVKQRLKGESFTSIATHDHRIINELKNFVYEENINRSNFEFQMLYGFRTDLQQSLTKEGYLFCTYVPFGKDWFGYFMRRLAERPQNIKLLLKDQLFDSEYKIRRKPIIFGSMAIALLTYILWRKKK